MSLPNGAVFAQGEIDRVKEAIAALEADAHAAREIAVKVTLSVFREYPKQVVVGKDEDGNPITKIINGPEEEAKPEAVPEAKPEGGE